MDAPLLDAASLGDAAVRVQRQPFAFLTASGLLPLAAREALQHEFPRYRQAGFFPHDAADCGPTLNRLIADATAPAFADALGERLGIPQLSARPPLVTLCAQLHRRHGTIHTDSRSKVVTALVYLESHWPHGSAGCLRLLTRGDDIAALAAPELAPVYGNFAAFARADHSFHGHLPFAGERRVIQIAWLTSHDELRRKQRRGVTSHWFKRLLGSLDRRIGAGRDVNAAHDD
ncbi:MAG: 2OG-Fe(II) oxygenase [Proteobacteria bacterium]|nr:2OG-Fe(II) oxygenase [Pseudomonadota bacterium]